MAGVELDSVGPKRKTTGKCFIMLVKNKLDTTFQEVIRSHVRAGSLVWTDGHKSYAWLNACPEYKHQEVVHARGHFSKKDEQGVVVSTNAVEGMFARVKRLLRTYLAMPRSGDGSGP